MLDIKFIRENPDLIKQAARKKRLEFDVDAFLKIDILRRSVLLEVEELRAKQNRASDRVATIEKESEKESAIKDLRELKDTLSKKEYELKKLDTEWRKLMMEVPNIPDPSVPDGEDERDNQEIKKWGEIPQFDFEPLDHVTLAEKLDLADFERGAKVAGFRGYFLKNEAAILSLAIWKFAQEFFLKLGEFTPMIAPALVNEEVFFGTGYLPQGKDDLYKTQDDTYLAGTSEVPVMGYFMDSEIDRKHLPTKILAFSPCFRREAGSYGKDTKGLMRVHEFFKLEQVILCEASHAESVKYHEWINSNMEKLAEALGLPYRTVVNCGGDLGLGQVKKYDVELWIPSERRYREISSASYFHDFQTRRLNIKYKTEDGKLQFAHSLNSTALPTPRILISLLENNQENDGSVRIPEVLQKYAGFNKIGPKK